MKPDAQLRLKSVRRALLAAAGIGAIATVALGFFSPEVLRPAYRLAAFACLAPAVGSLLFGLIHRLTGGQWGVALEPFLAAGAQLAPWIWLLTVPLLLFRISSGAEWPAYESTGMLVVRAAVYAVILWLVSRPLARRGEPPAWFGPAGFIVLVFTLHLLADDWLVALEPDWQSTAFPLVWMTGLAVTALALAVLTAVACGISPREPLTEPRALGLDWGNLLLAAMIFWCYVAFAQFLIIWAGDMPRETSWFEHRLHGGWALVPPVLALVHFVLPLVVLLSRRFKRSPLMLGTTAIILLVAQGIYTAWMILPAFPLNGLTGIATPLALLLTAVALFAHRYLSGALQRLKTP